VYLVDTDVISEVRKQERANPGVIAFFRRATASDDPVYLSPITVGELRRGVGIIRHRGDHPQADELDRWLELVLREYADNILSFDAEIAQVWGQLRVPHPENPLDKQIAATALIHDLTLVTRNLRHFQNLGVRLLNPFSEVAI
jgi:hypothetical protein